MLACSRCSPLTSACHTVTLAILPHLTSSNTTYPVHTQNPKRKPTISSPEAPEPSLHISSNLCHPSVPTTSQSLALHYIHDRCMSRPLSAQKQNHLSRSTRPNARDGQTCLLGNDRHVSLISLSCSSFLRQAKRHAGRAATSPLLREQVHRGKPIYPFHGPQPQMQRSNLIPKPHSLNAYATATWHAIIDIVAYLPEEPVVSSQRLHYHRSY